MQWIGFTVSDFVEFFIAFVFLALSWRRVQAYGRSLAAKPVWSMLALGLLPIALRLALLPQYPIPSPGVSDDFSYILLADTLRHFRLANPVHPLHRFFETFFVLQEPAYQSIFPLGQGLILAIGWTLFGHPWAGVALSIGALCALCYWMLRAWTTSGWALIGGLLAVIEFGPLNQWMNSYWGGAVSACAGCLVFGSLPRLRSGGGTRYAVLLGLGMFLQLLTRPYEAIFLILSALVFFLANAKAMLRPAGIAALVGAPALGLLLMLHWTISPYRLSQYQYGVPTTFTLQPLPTPHRPLTREQQLDYDQQSAVHGSGTDTFAAYWQRWASRIHFYRFFFLPPLYLAIPLFLLCLREFRYACVLAAILLFSLGTNFYPYFYSHYIAAITCLFILISVAGLERLNAWNELAARILLFLCAAHFLFWYGVHFSRDEQLYAAMTPFETSDTINHGDPQGRIAIRRQLDAVPGRQLVFVRYGPQHRFQEWVHNAADIDGARIVWARDLGPEENQKLLRYYRDRTAWLLEPDAHPPLLHPYPR
jgi:hypothetical protein